MWLQTYTDDGVRVGKVNADQIITLFAEEHNHEAEGEQWWEMKAEVVSARIIRLVRVTPHKYPTLTDCIDHMDEFDLVDRVVSR
jgi:hypothetical protein